VQVALITQSSMAMRSPSSAPSILRGSASTLGSSPLMNGITLSVMSSAETPGYPAPLIACMLTICTAWIPNRRSGASAITTGAAVQFELVTSPPPPQPYFSRCAVTRAA